MEYYFTAYKIIDGVLRGGAYSQIELNKNLTDEDKDNALITKLVYGVIEKSVQLDYIISQVCKSQPKPAVKNILKLGIYCLLYTDKIPEYAIISNSLKLCDKLGKGGVKGFVNGVLRNIKNYTLVYPQDKKEYLSVKYSVPKYLVSLLLSDYGEDCEKILSCEAETREHIRHNVLKSSAAQLEAIMGSNNMPYEKSAAGGYFVNYPQLLKLSEAVGKYSVMGFSSMLTINLIEPQKYKNILDTCAAPGGKSVYMAQLNPSADIVSCEIHPHRTELIKKYAKSCEVNNITAITCDSTVFNKEFENKFDLVLCDVPCSGSGMINKKPEIRMSITEDSLNSLTKLQSAILKNCSRYVKPDGTLIYSTCSVLKMENEEIVNYFLKDNSFNLVKGNTKFHNENGYLKLVGGLNASEGFFMAEMKKI